MAPTRLPEDTRTSKAEAGMSDEEEIRLGMTFVRLICRSCGITYLIPKAFHEGKQRDKSFWHCPNGHQWHYSESIEDKLRRERDQLTQRIAQKDDEVRDQRAEAERQRERAAVNERRVSAAKGQITKLKKRASNGVCPCCNRTFADLARHMHTKHPTFVTEPDATDHVVN